MELVEHLTTGVDWVGAVRAMTASGVTTFIEVGPAACSPASSSASPPMPCALPLDEPAAGDRLAIPFAEAAVADGSPS